MALFKVDQGTFVGDGNTNKAIVTGYMPKVLIQQRLGGEQMWMKVEGMSGSFAKAGDFTFDSNKLQFDATGFTTWLNANGQTYQWLALSWDSDNEIADIVTYTGNGVDNRDIATTVTNPKLVYVVKGTWTPVLRTTEFIGDSSQQVGNFVGSKIAADHIQSFGINSFQVGANGNVNENGTGFLALVLGASELLSVFSYVGNGADNRDLNTLGIDPNYVFIHRSQGGIFDNNSPVHKYASMVGDAALSWPSSGAPANNQIQAFITGGIQLGSDNGVNANGETYYGFAFLSGEIAPPPSGGGGSTPPPPPPPVDVFNPGKGHGKGGVHGGGGSGGSGGGGNHGLDPPGGGHGQGGLGGGNPGGGGGIGEPPDPPGPRPSTPSRHGLHGVVQPKRRLGGGLYG